MATILKVIIIAQKLINILITNFKNLYLNSLSDRLQNNINQDWKMYNKNFEILYFNLILDEMLYIFRLYISVLRYLKNKVLRFEDVTNTKDLTLCLNTCLD